MIFPKEYDPMIYLASHNDLANSGFSEEELRSHFDFYGKNEGRRCSAVNDRTDFISLIPKDLSILELGPFYNPVVKGSNVKYFDVLNHDELVARASTIGASPKNVPVIEFVDPNGNLDVINELFDVVVSSHCIEHQPDLIGHLQKVENLPRPGALFFLLIPDKRYCFDHFVPPTTIADLIERNAMSAKTHSLKNVIIHRALTTHNDPVSHWEGYHGFEFNDFEKRVNAAIEEFKSANGAYIDVHASFFTPDTFSDLINTINELNLVTLKIIRNYHTKRNQFEFFVIMEKPVNKTENNK